MFVSQVHSAQPKWHAGLPSPSLRLAGSCIGVTGWYKQGSLRQGPAGAD